MSRKMSRKSVLIAQLAEDENVKEALKVFAARIVNNSHLSSIYNDSDTDSDESDDGDEDQMVGDDADDEEEVPDLCNDCQCGKRSANENKKQMVISIKSNEKTNKKNNKTSEEVSIGLDDGSDDQSCDCSDCQQFDIECRKSDENAIKLVAEEEKKKKKLEKKKLQKKKKRDKRKAEKLTNSLNTSGTNGQKAIDISINTNDCDNSNNNNNKNENILKNNSNNSKQLKNETKMTAKQKNSNNLDKNINKNISKQKKDIENKPNLVSNGTKDTDKHSTTKSSPKSDREYDVLESDLEEEELFLNSAYVSQIAQRKTKPFVQKLAQVIQSEAQDYSHSNEDSGLKNTDNMSDNSTNSSFNSSNGFQKNENNFQNNKNFNKSYNNCKETEDLPKFKQYFFEQKKISKAPAGHTNQEMKHQNINRSIELAKMANDRAESNKFSEAIDLFSQALSLNPKDYRFYVNRSYCYDSIQDFRSALRDADTAIQLKPDWPKCHYRRGKALAGLKNYQESEISLKKVLTLEKDCDEALSELWHVRYGAIVDMGYDTTTATLYSSQYQSIKDALDALAIRAETIKSFNTYNKINTDFRKPINNYNQRNHFTNNNTKSGDIWADDDIYISDDEYNSVREPTFEETSPTNPFGWKALWIGNVSLNAKLETVTTMFRKFGNLNYCNIFKGNNGGNFILVHYDNPDSPRLAMTKYQGKSIPGISITGSPLTIRFRPNKDQKKPNYDQRLESDECYYWRTTGCARGDKCLYKHIQANKGVDKQAWMCNPLRKGLQPFNKTQK